MGFEGLTWGGLTLAQRDATPATEGAAAPGTTGGQTSAPSGPGNSIFLFMLPLLFIMIIFTMTSGRKQRKKQMAMMAGLKKYDRVQTAGGIIGTIVELKEHDMVVCTDDATNTRIRMVRTAVQVVLGKSDGKSDGKGDPGRAKSEAVEQAAS